MEYRITWEIKSIGSDYLKLAIYIFSVFLMLILSINLSIIPAYASSIKIEHNGMTGNLTDRECLDCHTDAYSKQASKLSIQQEKPSTLDMSINTVSTNNYTPILKVGQTTHQLGAFLRNEGFTGWSWWDTADIFGNYPFGKDVQKNLVTLMLLDNSSGTVRPVTGLVTPPTYPQVTRRNHSNYYSYKADTNDPTITYRWDSTGTIVVYAENNYENNVDLLMIKEIDLGAISIANLTFWTWYVMERDYDYGYVMISTDLGNTWTHLSGTLTTTANPYSENLGNGITGTSPGWVQETMDITPFTGKKVLLGFRFKSDPGVNEEGWYIDDLNIISGSTTIFTDDAETLIIPKTLSVNVTYPNLVLINKTDPLTNATTLQFTQHTQQVNLMEDLGHPGTYGGYFRYDPRNEQYSGNYTVSLETIVNGTQVSASTEFQTTIWGCQNCHNKRTDANGTNYETSFIHMDYGGLAQSCTYVCHSGSRGFYAWWNSYSPWLEANPMHIHEMQYGHEGGFPTYYPPIWKPYNVPAHTVNISCAQCHTNFLHDNSGTDTAMIGNYTLYGKNISYPSNTHRNLTCETCHGDLKYPDIPQQYSLQGTLGNYNPSFTSHISFTDAYIIAVNGSENLNVTISGNTTSSISVYIIGPVDNTTTGLQTNPEWGHRSLTSPFNVVIGNPNAGTWLVKVIQDQGGVLINYTITSNYPIMKKQVIKIPECNICHNSNGAGNAFTKDQIPDWNPGFAHADTNNDGALDIQCRMCHNAMHDITIKNCQTCHTTAPFNHPISDPSFSQYTQSQCLACHGDPHKVTASGGGCIGCHSSPGQRYYVNTSLFGKHANVNSSGGTNNVTDADCMTCHFRSSDIIMSPDAGLGAANHSNTRFCDDCHTTGGSGPIKPTNPALMKNGLSHGSTNCQWCHIAGDPLPRPLDSPLRFHPNGPMGTASGKNCLSCHYSANLPDMPFHAPGEGHSSSNIDDCSYCHYQADNHAVTPINSNTPPSISGLFATSPVTAGSPVQIQATITDDLTQIAAARYQVKKGSTIVKDWTNMTPKDGRFNSPSEVVNASIDILMLPGTYTVNIKGMASAYKTNPALPYYPLNGQWSEIISTQLIVKEPEGYDNGTVYGILGNHIAGAIVSTDTGLSTTTNETGFYSLSLVNGTYHLTASKEPEYYPNNSVTVTVIAYINITTNIILDMKPIGNITGKVTNK